MNNNSFSFARKKTTVWKILFEIKFDDDIHVDDILHPLMFPSWGLDAFRLLV